MKLTNIEKFEAEGVIIELAIFLDKKPAKYNLVYSYTCPECMGHGCRFKENALRS